jgi:hypothetical protein
MNDKSVDGNSVVAAHVLQSMLADQAAVIEQPSAVERRRCFAIRAAESVRERRTASRLVERMYASRGYEGASLPSEESPHRKTFLACEHNEPIGTLTISTDSIEGLKVDSVFPEEVAQFRAEGHRICEFTKLAMDRAARSPRLLASLFHVAYIYAHRVQGLSHLLIEVNPRHVRYYVTMLGFTVVGPVRHNTIVNAPAVLLSLDLSYAKEQIAQFGGRPELSVSERSAYPYFFSAKDERGIVDRLTRPDEDFSHVFEFADHDALNGSSEANWTFTGPSRRSKSFHES